MELQRGQRTGIAQETWRVSLETLVGTPIYSRERERESASLESVVRVKVKRAYLHLQ